MYVTSTNEYMSLALYNLCNLGLQTYGGITWPIHAFSITCLFDLLRLCHARMSNPHSSFMILKHPRALLICVYTEGFGFDHSFES